MSEETCSSAGPEWIVLYFILVIYCFYAVAEICKYLLQSLQVICDKLKLSADVAGASFLAAGTSIPELFCALLDVFYTHNEIGTGAVIGSVIFNIFCMIGGSALILGRMHDNKLDWHPLVRDMSFYACTILLFSIVVSDNKIDWWESVFLLALYGVYILIMKFNPQLRMLTEQNLYVLKRRLYKNKPKKEDTFTKDVPSLPPFVGLNDEDDVIQEIPLDDLNTSTDSPPTTPKYLDQPQTPTKVALLELVLNFILFCLILKSFEEELTKPEEEVPSFPSSKVDLREYLEEVGEPFNWPKTRVAQVVHVISFPLKFANWLTIPNLKKWSMNFWPLTFIMSIGWITVWVFIMVTYGTALGCALGVKPVVIGITLLAVGTSFPDYMSSLFSARKGYIDMAIANTLGSNTFDVLVGLGVPWFAKCILTGGEPVILHENHIRDQILSVVISWFITLALLWKLKLTKFVGWVMHLFYILFIGFVLLQAYNVIPF